MAWFRFCEIDGLSGPPEIESDDTAKNVLSTENNKLLLIMWFLRRLLESTLQKARSFN
jgi:hypothetical protein